MVGGTTVRHTGLGRGNIFDPSDYGSATWGWTQTGDLAEGRWYPTATTLGNGQVLAFSGRRYYQMLMFGGVEASGTKLNDLRPLNLTDAAAWLSITTTGSPPPGLEGASAVLTTGNGRMNVFGGETAAGYSYSLWPMLRKSTNQGETWKWEQEMTPCDTCRWPSPRSRHSASNDTREVPATRDTMWVFGGRNANGAIAGDTVWRYTGLSEVNKRWKALVPANGPGPRYGHTTVWVPPRASAGSSPQLLIYGGRKADSTLADETLWILRLWPPDQEQWFSVLPSGTKPAKREGHTAIMDENANRSYASGKRRVYIFGGEGSSGLLQDTWIFSRSEGGTDNGWTWQQHSTTNTPTARTRHAAIYDSEFERMLVFAGDTTSASPGGEKNDLWGLKLATQATVWDLVSASTPPAARARHCVAWHPAAIISKIPERFTPSGSSGSWSSLTTGSKLQPHYYPHMFLLRTGKLFWAGNNATEEVDPTGTSWIFNPLSQAWSDSTSSGFIGGCSVMFRPDTVLKTGLGENLVGNNAKIAVVDSAALSNSITWGSPVTLPMPEDRAYHNLTILPTGKVLLSGGFKFNTDPYNANPLAYIYYPRLWDPTTGTWSDSLEKDPAKRQYHSTALLLPDGRVLSSGGDPSEAGATVYWPPYLYDNAGNLATRPVINGVTLSCASLAEYDSSKITVSCDTTGVTNVVLLKPGAVTHQLNMDQRYVPLRFQKVAGGLSVTGPKTVNHAPPGHYLLFILKTVSGNPDPIPSVAKWVRVGPDVVTPGQTTNLAEYVTGLTFIDVMWTAPGDDAACGQAVKYDVRYSLNPITSSNFNQAGTVSKGAPQAAGAEEIAHRASLLPCTTYYFALKTQDEAGNWSSMSNVVSVTTECLGEGLMASGSGPNGWTVENTLLGEAPGTEPQTDVYRLKGELVPSDGRYHLRLSQPDPLKTLLEGVELVAVEHDPGAEAFAVGERIVLGTRAPASEATSEGHDLRSLVDGTSSTGWVGHPGDTLELRIPGLAADSALLVIGSARRGGSPAESLGIEIRARDRNQEWVTRRHYRPRARLAEYLLESVASERVRLVLHGEYTVRYVGVVSLAAEAPKLEPLTLASAKLEGQDVTDLAAPGGSSLLLVSGGEVELAFMLPESEAKGRALFLTVRGSWTNLPSTPSLRSRLEEASLPRVFALHPPRPNPARGVVRIGFDVPHTSPVSIEIFDLLGRRVRTLMRGEQQPGSHALEWDRRDEAGSRLGPGVYLYRMEAEGFHARRKLVMLP